MVKSISLHDFVFALIWFMLVGGAILTGLVIVLRHAGRSFRSRRPRTQRPRR
jgi:hypothetical protein